MEWTITAGEAGRTYLLQGNEAIARGALEAGIRFAAAYPGSPSSEILDMLGHVAAARGLYAEWSVNETSALEACMGASLGGVRSLCVLKQNGLLTVGDALHTAALSGCRGGVVLVVSDDPSAHSSTNEFDSRHQARSAAIPLLEPATFQEALDMVRFAFDLSDELHQIVMVRTTTRINHGRGNVVLGALPGVLTPPAKVGTSDRLAAVNALHPAQLAKLDRAQDSFEGSVFNSYEGPDEPELTIVASGAAWFYGRDAVDTLDLRDRVGVLKLGTTWPLPERLVVGRLARTRRVLVLEEVDPFLERNLAMLAGYHPGEVSVVFSGRDGRRPAVPRVGELNPDIAGEALAGIMGVSYQGRAGRALPADMQGLTLPDRQLTFCAGCPHRATFFALKQALALEGTGGTVFLDIGCYTLGGARAGHFLVNALGCMGGGINMAQGLAQLGRFGFDQPIVAFAGDSTFFHACMPGLVNAKYHNANLLFLVLDNSATAMTGFQPHPGIGTASMGERLDAISIEEVAAGVGVSVHVADPFEIERAAETMFRLLRDPGTKVLILRQPCAMLSSRARQLEGEGGKETPRVWVDPDLCRADQCGCGRFCSRVFGCPANIWNYETGKAEIDEVVCTGCGVCATLCPAGAIKVEGDTAAVRSKAAGEETAAGAPRAGGAP